MINKVLSILQFLLIIFFLLFINYYYFSDVNINKIYKNRTNLSLNLSKNADELPLLSNDTNNIIEYQNNDESMEKIKKIFWNLLNKMNRKPIITSIKTYYLTKNEKKLFKKEKPWGIILFKRNIKSFQQVKLLTESIRKTIRDPYYPILVDEEGGDVSRFSDLINSKELSQKFFGNMYEKNKNNGKKIYQYYLNSICSVLRETGININTIPVLDILHKKTAKILNNRCFSSDKKNIKILGKLCVTVLKKTKLVLFQNTYRTWGNKY